MVQPAAHPPLPLEDFALVVMSLVLFFLLMTASLCQNPCLFGIADTNARSLGASLQLLKQLSPSFPVDSLFPAFSVGPEFPLQGFVTSGHWHETTRWVPHWPANLWDCGYLVVLTMGFPPSRADQQGQDFVSACVSPLSWWKATNTC